MTSIYIFDIIVMVIKVIVKILKMENNWKDNDEIITTPLTFVSTNHAICTII